MPRLRSILQASLIALGACSSLPNAGPTTSQVYKQAMKQETVPFGLVEITPSVVNVTASSPRESLPALFHGRPPPPKVGVGDVVSITIWQSGVPGLPANSPSTTGNSPLGGSSTNGSGQLTLPDQLISTDGGLTIPYAGRIRAAGRTPYQIQQAIEEALSQRLLEPKVLVTVPKSVTETATVVGESLGGVRTPLSPAGDRLLDVIAAAGGPKAPLYETYIRLTRGAVTGSVSMDRLVLDPLENVLVWPGDSISIVHVQKTFSVFGATQNNSQLPFNSAQLNLAQAIARAGGLLDARADPSGVFLFRFEPSAIASAVGAQTSPQTQAGIPVLYHLDLLQAGGYFLASRFPMKDSDLIYVAGASSNDIQKFFGLISSVTLPVLSGAILAK